MKSKPIIIIRFKAMGVPWKACLFTDADYMSKHSDDSLALTLGLKKQIDFMQSHVDIGVIRHELRHAFTNELCLESADISNHQMEEIQCTLDQYHYDNMARIVFNIYSKFLAFSF